MNAWFLRCQTCNLFQKQIRVKSCAEMRVLCKFEGSRTLNFHALYRLCNLVRASDAVPPSLGPPSLPPLLFCIMQILGAKLLFPMGCVKQGEKNCLHLPSVGEQTEN